jgi:hypothetical protein
VPTGIALHHRSQDNEILQTSEHSPEQLHKSVSVPTSLKNSGIDKPG